jgi:ATPase subunit of ABC transporter with duplicated ATPase domains
MTVLRLSEIDLSFPGSPVLQCVSAVLSFGSRIGIVGPNGSGKTSLVRLILGEIEPERGSVDWIKKPKVGYVPQIFHHDGSKTPLDLIGYERAEYLGQCGVGRNLWDNPAENLSGGEKTRLSLAMALSSRPEMLILDEPTNHLDIPGIEWLEKLLSSYKGTVLTVSHDRSFLDAVCQEIWEVREGRLTCFPGNYSDYVRTVEANLAYERREYAKWSREVRELTKEIRSRRQWYDKAHKDAGQDDFLRRKAKKHARQFKAKEAALQRLEARKPRLTRDEQPVLARVAHAGKRTQTILRAEGLGFEYPGSGETEPRPILSAADFRVRPGQKIGLIGRNGCGKTTLLRLITGTLSPTDGMLWVNPGINTGYLAQMLEGLDGESSAAANVSSETGLKVGDARNLLGRLAVMGEAQMRPFRTLSMGERTRVAVACLCFGEYDVLLLDEPTNHLDVTAREAVEAALESFPGAVVVATHDRFLLNRLCKTIWHMESGSIAVHEGTYSDFRKRRDDSGSPEDKNREASELAVKAEIAYLVSLISAAKDPAEKAELEERYTAALAKLKEIRARGQ